MSDIEVMRAISRQRADELLASVGIQIGGWNELCVLHPDAVSDRLYSPPSEAIDLYVIAHRLAQWVISGTWTVLQVDNSTAPTDDEIAIFEKIVFNEKEAWDVAAQHTFLLEGQGRLTTLVLLIYFALLFEWHVHLTSELLSIGQRLALQDGTVYFFGDATALRSAEGLIDGLVTEPRRLST